MKLDTGSELYRHEQGRQLSTVDPIRRPPLLTLIPDRVIRDDIGRVVWIITPEKRWFGLKYETSSSHGIAELIEPFVVWKKNGNRYFAFHLNRIAPVFTEPGSQMSFSGEVTVNQMTGQVNILMF